MLKQDDRDTAALQETGLRAQLLSEDHRPGSAAKSPADNEFGEPETAPGPDPVVRAKGHSAPRELFRSDYMRKLLNYHFVLVASIPAVGTLAAMILALRDGIGAVDVLLLVAGYVLTFVGVEVGFHRLFAHRSFQATPGLRLALAILGSMAAQGPLVYWTTVHRHHHAFSDREGDMHSPRPSGRGMLSFVIGLFHAHMGWMFDHPIPNAGFYVPDLLKDRLIRKVNQHYYACILAGLMVPAVIGWAVTGTELGALKGFLWGGLVRIFLVDHMTWSVNSICHVFGRRRFPTRDDSRNNFWLAIPTFGQSWHNNHHAFPWSAKVGLSRSEIDLGTAAIQIFQILGLASQVKAPTAAMIKEKELEVTACQAI